MAKRAPIFVKRDLRECRKALRRLGGSLRLAEAELRSAKSVGQRMKADTRVAEVRAEIETMERKIHGLERELMPTGWEPKAWR